MPEASPTFAAQGSLDADSDASCPSVATSLAAARLAQSAWARSPLAVRLKWVRKLRALIAGNCEWLAGEIARSWTRPAAEILMSEVLPFAEACRFLEANAYWLLSPQVAGSSGRPMWLRRVVTSVQREPLGVVLVIGPGNYPLFLPAVQVLQALVAGNAVLLKPAPGAEPAAHALADLAEQAGLPDGLLTILSSDKSAAEEAIALNVDKVFLTGSHGTGRAVYAECAKAMTPAVMELSGCDPVIVAEDADLDLTVRAVVFGLRLNDGATCISPRRVFVHRSIANEFETRLVKALAGGEPIQITGRVAAVLKGLLTEAIANGARLCHGQSGGDGSISGPVVLADARQEMSLLNEDVFAPVLSLVGVADEAEAIAQSNACEYQLGASVFSRDLGRARRIASALRAGCVTVNDLVAPTADPRAPFGGTGRSGFGTTRGAEGLLEMTRPKVVLEHRGFFRPHFDPAQPGDAGLFAAVTRVLHLHGLRRRWQALAQLVAAGRLRGKSGSNSVSSRRKKS